MKKVVYLSSLIVSLVLISSCAHQPPPVPQWRYAREAIHLQIHADANLNLHEGKPHTLMICIYQLSRKSGFNSLTEEIDGRYKLLECQPFDGTVANTKRLIIHPGDQLNLLMDRFEGARHLAIVAGYYLLQKKRIIRMVDFPVITESHIDVRRLFLPNIFLDGGLLNKSAPLFHFKNISKPLVNNHIFWTKLY